MLMDLLDKVFPKLKGFKTELQILLLLAVAAAEHWKILSTTVAEPIIVALAAGIILAMRQRLDKIHSDVKTQGGNAPDGK